MKEARFPFVIQLRDLFGDVARIASSGATHTNLIECDPIDARAFSLVERGSL